MQYGRWGRHAVALAILAATATGALADDNLKLAIGQRGNWETAIAELGNRAGIFKKHNLNLELLYTAGAGETLQTIISGAADIGIGVGTGGAMGAFAKGAPVRAIGNATVGSNDLFWYVKADSPLKAIKDATDKTTIAYSTAGSSTNMIVLGFIKTFDLKSKAEKTGSPPATLTAVMSGQVDVGWAAPPFGLKEIEEGKIRIIGRGGDVPSMRNQTVRLVVVNADRLKKDKAVIARFMDAYRETLDWMYSDPKALGFYKDFSGIPENLTKKTMNDFYPKATLDPDRISDIDSVMTDAVASKFLPAPLSKDQVAEFFQVPPKKQ
ncbi:MAG TPA: ABC transporter substrate-binding protein [Pseudolabrys sp.]|nr:ABC transporter substrate-binding protein [Pseudolabrys sp.]